MHIQTILRYHIENERPVATPQVLTLLNMFFLCPLEGCPSSTISLSITSIAETV